MKDRIKRLAGGKGVSGNASRRPERGQAQIRSVFLTRAHSWGWLLKISILCVSLVIAALIALYLADDIIKVIGSVHLGMDVTSENYLEILKDHNIIPLLIIIMGLFSLVFNQGHWVIKNHDTEKGTQDTFSGQRETSLTNAAHWLLEEASSGGSARNAHGLRELARLAQQGAIEKERIDALTRLAPDFQGADFADARLAGIDLRSAQLSGAPLTRVDLSGTSLLYARLTEADLRSAQLSGATLTRADLSGTSLLYARLTEADLRWAQLFTARLIEADLSKARLIEANLTKANLTGACLKDADLSRANLIGANLRGADLCGADMICCELPEAKLIRADLRKTGLEKANLFMADLRKADLSGADLRKADLSGADLRKADLRGADLRSPMLAEADLEGAVYDKKTKFPEGFEPAKCGLQLLRP